MAECKITERGLRSGRELSDDVEYHVMRIDDKYFACRSDWFIVDTTNNWHGPFNSLAALARWASTADNDD